MRLAAALLTTALLAGGCGQDVPATEQPVAGEGLGVGDDAGPLVSCSGSGSGKGWSVDDMADGTGALSRSELTEAFTAMLADAQARVELKHFLPDGPRTEARVLLQQQDTYAVGVGRWTMDGPQGDQAMELDMEHTDSGWRWLGGGSCHLLAPVLAPDDSWVHVFAPDGGLDTTSTDVSVLVSELQCASGRDPAPYLHDPNVRETDDAVVVSWTTDTAKGINTCPGNPTVERTITLAAPLGDRPLLDGSQYPPVPVAPQLGFGGR